MEEIIEKVPTPLAYVARRVCAVGPSSSADTFLVASYYFEAYLKLLTSSVVSSLEIRTPDLAYELSHTLVRAEGLGQWHESLSQGTAHPVSGYLSPGMQPLIVWLTKKRTKVADPWFETIQDACANLFRLLGIDGDDAPRFSKVHGLLAALVQVRNKTKAHGAVGPDFFDKANPLYLNILTTLSSQCPLCKARFVVFSKKADGRHRGHWLVGVTPRHMREDELPMTPPADGLYFYSTPTDTPVALKLLQHNRELSRFLFPNGNWNDKTKSAEFLDYSNGDRSLVELIQFSRPPVRLPHSDTHGTDSVDVQSNVFGNLPALPIHYVSRPTLEQQLNRLLYDPNHHIITLHGTGGVGKTSLALRAAHGIAQSNDQRFEQVIWFSARDLDLRQRGAIPVRPAVQTLEEIANRYGTLFGRSSDIAAFASILEGKDQQVGATLFIFDNFETLADPRALHEFLDTHTVIPNKVLITSRERAFKADYPIEVKGMEWPEADTLLRQLARSLHIEGDFDEDRRRRVFDAADGHPYIMRILTGEVAATGKNRSPETTLSSRDDILDALFERSFVRLSDGGKWVFLLVSNWKAAVPEILLLAVGNERRRDLHDGIEECRRASLINEVETADSHICLEAPQVARNFGKRKLRGDPDRLLIEEDLRTIQQFGVIQRGVGNQTLSGMLDRYCLERIRDSQNVNDEARNRIDSLLVRVAERWPRAWRHVADFRASTGADGALADEAARRAVEADHYNSDLWQHRARLARNRSDIHTEILCLVTCVELNPRDVKLVSDTANRLNQILKDIPQERRTTYLATVRDTMERLVSRFDATDRSRLGWLYLYENNIDKAVEHGNAGLELEPHNQHCKNLLARIERGV